MIANSKMREGRFLRWHNARMLCREIEDHLASGGIVVVATMTKATMYSKKHIGMFKADKSGVYVRRGKSWDCIDYCGIRFGR